MQNFIDNIKLHLRKRRAYRKTFDELHGMSSRELSDIGIAPYEIPDIARQQAERQT